LPGDWSQLKPFFETPVDDATLARYSLLQTGQLGDAQNQYLVPVWNVAYLADSSTGRCGLPGFFVRDSE